MKKSCAYYSSLSSGVFLEVLLFGRSVAVDHDQVVAGLGLKIYCVSTLNCFYSVAFIMHISLCIVSCRLTLWKAPESMSAR